MARPRLNDSAFRAVVPVRPNEGRKDAVVVEPIIARDEAQARILAHMAVRSQGLVPRRRGTKVNAITPEIR